jgi:hypothetical protein
VTDDGQVTELVASKGYAFPGDGPGVHLIVNPFEQEKA